MKFCAYSGYMDMNSPCDISWFSGLINAIMPLAADVMGEERRDIRVRLLGNDKECFLKRHCSARVMGLSRY